MAGLQALTDAQLAALELALAPPMRTSPNGPDAPSEVHQVLGNADYLASTFTALFVSAANSAEDQAVASTISALLSDQVASVGGSCSRYDATCPGKGNFDADEANTGVFFDDHDQSSVSLAARSNAMRKGFLLRACREVLDHDSAVTTALSRASLTDGSEAGAAELGALYGQFFPGSVAPPEVVTAQVWLKPAVIWVTPVREAALVAEVCTSTGVLWVVGVAPLPSWPLAPCPQHLTPPEVVRAQVWVRPAVIWVMPERFPIPSVASTSTGVLLYNSAPLPSWPFQLFPQHLAPPEVVRAQVWEPPAVIWVTPERVPLPPVASTSTGVLWVVGVSPLPSWPLAPYPQHLTPPEVMRAQVWRPPAVIWVTSERFPIPSVARTSTGVLLSNSAPSPSRPLAPFPQHLTPPVVVRAQVWEPPAVIWVTPVRGAALVAEVCTSTGVLWIEGVSPLPSWPQSPAPQHLTPPEVVRAQVWLLPAVIWVALKFQAEAPGPVKVPVP